MLSAFYFIECFQLLAEATVCHYPVCSVFFVLPFCDTGGPHFHPFDLGNIGLCLKAGACGNLFIKTSVVHYVVIWPPIAAKAVDGRQGMALKVTPSDLKNFACSLIVSFS